MYLLVLKLSNRHIQIDPDPVRECGSLEKRLQQPAETCLPIISDSSMLKPILYQRERLFPLPASPFIDMESMLISTTLVHSNR
jgi:hypothetical protein